MEVKLGDIMAHVVVRIGKSQIESVITRRSAEQLSLKKGDKVTVEKVPREYGFVQLRFRQASYLLVAGTLV